MVVGSCWDSEVIIFLIVGVGKKLCFVFLFFLLLVVVEFFRIFFWCLDKLFISFVSCLVERFVLVVVLFKRFDILEVFLFLGVGVGVFLLLFCVLFILVCLCRFCMYWLKFCLMSFIVLLRGMFLCFVWR